MEELLSVKDEYLAFRDGSNLKTNKFEDRVKLQLFLKKRLAEIWSEKPNFSNGGLLSNYMTRYAIGFAYYDCRPSLYCKSVCYGLPLSGPFDYNMLRLGVITSEAFKTGDTRYIGILKAKLNELKLKHLKIGHWGDAVLDQIPHIAKLASEISTITFWWYSRKKEIALAVNERKLPNLRAYLSLDPTTEYPTKTEYPYGITYLFGDGQLHKNHEEILSDKRLIALFPLKKGRTVEDPNKYGLAGHKKMCKEKKLLGSSRIKGHVLCLSCPNRCNYSPI